MILPVTVPVTVACLTVTVTAASGRRRGHDSSFTVTVTLLSFTVTLSALRVSQSSNWQRPPGRRQPAVTVDWHAFLQCPGPGRQTAVMRLMEAVPVRQTPAQYTRPQFVTAWPSGSDGRRRRGPAGPHSVTDSERQLLAAERAREFTLAAQPAGAVQRPQPPCRR